MKKEIIISASDSQLRAALLEDGRLVEIFIESPSKECRVGSIYLGRVQRVIQGMNAAFVEIGLEQDAFLHFSDVGSATDEFKELLDGDDDLEGDDDTEAPKAPARSSRSSSGQNSDRRRGNDQGRDRRGPRSTSTPNTPKEEPAADSAADSAADATPPTGTTGESQERNNRRRPPRRNSQNRTQRDLAFSHERPSLSVGLDDTDSYRPDVTSDGVDVHTSGDSEVRESDDAAQGSADKRRGRRGRRPRRGRGGRNDRVDSSGVPVLGVALPDGRYDDVPLPHSDVDGGVDAHELASATSDSFPLDGIEPPPFDDYDTSEPEGSLDGIIPDPSDPSAKPRRRRKRGGRRHKRKGGTQTDATDDADTNETDDDADTSSDASVDANTERRSSQRQSKDDGSQDVSAESGTTSSEPRAPRRDMRAPREPRPDGRKPREESPNKEPRVDLRDPAAIRPEEADNRNRQRRDSTDTPSTSDAAPSDRGAATPSARTSGRTNDRRSEGRSDRAAAPRETNSRTPRKGAPLPTFFTKRAGEVTIGLEKNQDVVVQVTREPYASKGVRVSTRVSLPGRFLVLLPLDNVIGVSRKIQQHKDRRRLHRIARSILPAGYGCIIRTVAEDKDEEVIRQDLMSLIDKWKEIEKKLKVSKAPTFLYEDSSIANTVIRDLLTPDVSRVVIDDKAVYRQIRDYVEWAAPALANNVEMYSGAKPIFEKYGVERELERTFQRKIYIPSGGYIIMEQTEAMMVIDVNSGRYADNKEQEMNALRTNTESAREIARQLRLRDVGGLVIIDFIDLYDERNRKKIYDELRKEMRRDRAKSVVLPMTQFGLVQITRQRIRQQIIHSLAEPCPTCSGSGMVQPKSMVISRIERWLDSLKAAHEKVRKLELRANPVIVDHLTDGTISSLAKLMLKYRLLIKAIPDEKMAFDTFQMVATRTGEDLTEKYLT